MNADRWVRRVTLALAALATASAGLAVAEPGTPAVVSLAGAPGLFLDALAAHLWLGRRFRKAGPAARPGRATRPAVVVGLLVVFALPFAVGAGRLAWSGRAETLEVVLLSGLRNLGLGLAARSRRPAFARLAALVSLFLVLATSSLAEGPAVPVLLGLYAAAGGCWLALNDWRGLRLPPPAEASRRFPVAALVVTLGLVGSAVAAAAAGPPRVAAALAEVMPSSGGTSGDDPDARGGVNDGDNEVKGSTRPESVGFTDTDVYLTAAVRVSMTPSTTCTASRAGRNGRTGWSPWATRTSGSNATARPKTSAPAGSSRRSAGGRTAAAGAPSTARPTPYSTSRGRPRCTSAWSPTTASTAATGTRSPPANRPAPWSRSPARPPGSGSTPTSPRCSGARWPTRSRSGRWTRRHCRCRRTCPVSGSAGSTAASSSAGRRRRWSGWPAAPCRPAR